jgi:hypothetical protein
MSFIPEGAEWYLAESIVTPGQNLRRWITPKRKLAVFAPLSVPADAPNYFPEAVLHVLERALDEKTVRSQKRRKRRG